MVEIRLRNSRSRTVETVTPLDPAKGMRMYLCGPTVYDRAHLGNARNVILFDVLYRLLRHVSPGNGWAPPIYVRNFTDVDDKINAKAAETGRSIAEITEETIGWYHADMDALGNLRPDHEPRATAYIGEMIAMIETLIADGHAYAAEGHVLFRVRSFAAYGRLSGRTVDDMIAGARVEVAPFKENPMDFVLWKPSTDDLPGWDSPWGRGRPGWHIECSAMSKALLGDVFDIHGGGNDLLFPHHENEIAQSCCANHTDRMAQIWLHNEMLLVEGKKMSKSLGNFFTVRDLLDQGVPGEVIRFVFLSTHYSKPMDWTDRKATQARKKLAFWRRKTMRERVGHVEQRIIHAITQDINTPMALSVLDELAKQERWSDLKASARLLGLLEAQGADWDWRIKSASATKAKQSSELRRLREQNLDYFVAQKRFNDIYRLHDLLIDTSESSKVFVDSKTFSKLRDLDARLTSLLRDYKDIDFDSAAQEAKEWRRLGKKYPNLFSLVDAETEKSLGVFKKAAEARIDRIALKMEAAREKGRFHYADKLRSEAARLGFEIIATKDGVRWRPFNR